MSWVVWPRDKAANKHLILFVALNRGEIQQDPDVYLASRGLVSIELGSIN